MMAKQDWIRRWLLNHIIHHRERRYVYLRLNNIPAPALYGQSGDADA